jgi:hypothetical protein
MASAQRNEDGEGDEGVPMSMLAVGASAVAVACACVAAGAVPAAAGTPKGTCTNSYSPYTYDQLAFDQDAQAIFTTIDSNGDGVICFKFYPNGPHAGHLGNLVDDKAAPHS